MQLFISMPEFEKVAGKPLDKDPSMWMQQIIQYMSEELPYIDTSSIELEIKQQDYDSGAAVIAAIINRGKTPGKDIIIPIIVKNHELSPIDVIQIGQEIHPLTKETYETFTHKANMFSELKPLNSAITMVPIDDYPMVPPRTGKTVYASDKSCLVDDGDMVSFKNSIEDLSIKSAFRHNSTESIVDSYLARDTSMTKTASSYSEAYLSEDICQIRSNGMRKYSWISSPSNMYVPVEKIINREEAVSRICSINNSSEAEKIANLILDNLDNLGGEASFVKKSDDIWSGFSGEPPVEYNPITKFGRYNVKTINGNTIEGYVFTNVIDFSGNKVNQKLFTTGLTGPASTDFSSIQDDIFGESATFGNTSYSEEIYDLPGEDIVKGHTGIFVMSSDGDAIATIPVRILSTIKMDNSIGGMAETMLGEKIPFYLQGGIKEIRKISVPDSSPLFQLGREVYLIPDSMVFKNTNNFVKLVDSNPMREQNIYKEKTAQDSSELDIFCDSGRYTLQGACLDKLADIRDMKEKNLSYFLANSPNNRAYYEHDNIKKAEAKFILINLGVMPKDADSVLEKAAEKGHLKISGTKSITSPEKVEARMNKIAGTVQTICNGLRINLVKEASVLTDPDSVDQILSLNFISPSNVYEYVEEIPNMERIAKKLAELLVMCRLGLKDIPENAIKTAMINLQHVINKLKYLKFMINNLQWEGKVE